MSEKLKILFVDDEPSILHGVLRALRPMCLRWDLHTATSGDDALKILVQEPFDVLITDLRMPGLDGSDLANEVLVRFPWMGRIMLTGMVDRKSHIRGSQWAHRVLTKPCSSEQLCAEIVGLIAHRGQDCTHSAGQLDVLRPGPLQVLTIDKSPRDSQLLRQALLATHSDVELLAVGDYESALRLAGGPSDAPGARPAVFPHVMVLDVNQPGLVAYDFLARYRSSALPKVPVVVVMDSMRERDVMDAIRRGAAHIVPKPWSEQRYLGLAKALSHYAVLSAASLQRSHAVAILPSGVDAA